MATFATPAPAETSSAANDSDLGSILSGAYDEATSDQPIEQPVDDGSDPTADAEVDQTVDAEVDPNASNEGPYKLAEDGHHYLVPKNELAAYTGMKQFNDQVQGMFPTLGDAKTAHAHSQDMQFMDADYTSGDPANIDRFLQHFAGADASDQYLKDIYAKSFETLASRVPEILKSVNPAAHQQFTSTITQSVMAPKVDAAYQAASEALATYGDKSNEYKTAIYAAQVLDFNTRGKYDKAPQAKPVVDPRISDIERREQALQTESNARVDDAFKQFNQTQLDVPKWQQFDAALDEALAPIKDKFAPKVFSGIRTEARNELIAELNKDAAFGASHQSARMKLETAFRNITRNRQDPSVLKPHIAAYHNDLLLKARTKMGPIAASILKEATAKAVAPTKTAAKPQAQARPHTPSQQAPQQQKNKLYDRKSDPEWANIFR